jgi:hypothetical protein
MRSLPLRREPSVRQIETILRRIEEELASRGARIDRAGTSGGLRFRMPWPWKAPRLGVLLFISSGRAIVSAGAGGPWKVRYALDFSVLLGFAITLSLALIAVGLSWPDRTQLLNALLIVWVIIYGIPYVLATVRFRRIIQKSTQDVIERRRVPRDSGSQPTVAETPQSRQPPVTGADTRPAE